ncbi:hypothetical protein ACFO0A_02580 [Novosphingobium tardum]|uniref:Lipoprotein n=1 Tax=Novosphingobium tardum TaxID=1538021 RepID=A0ABV8RKV1_9SPHN
MKTLQPLMLAPLGALLLSGCLAKTALDVVTLPVKVASKGVDLATTSQSEADEKRGREIRKREEKLGQLGRKYDKLSAKCAHGDTDACAEGEKVRAEMDALSPGIPIER